jgi:hypothetical protein
MTFTAQGNAARPLLAIVGAMYQRICQQKDAEIAGKLRAPSAHTLTMSCLFNAPHDDRQYLPARKTPHPKCRNRADRNQVE